VQQFADGWQLIRIPAGNLAVEQALINKEPAILAAIPLTDPQCCWPVVNPANSPRSSASQHPGCRGH
jgi:hypothetical protein